MSKKLIIANWKMNPPTLKEAELLFKAVVKNAPTFKKTEVVICPPVLYLANLKQILPRRSRATGSKRFSFGAQNVFYEEKGAYTGRISAEMIYSIGARYVILGHSERRARGENNSAINKKIKSALSSGLIPILCIGENERDESHEYFNVVKNQLLECLDGISKNQISKIIITYEPIWAISTTANRRDATSADAREMSVFIQKVLTDKFGVKIKLSRIIYGGSANEKNVEDFLTNGGVDGCMPGAASLKPEKFIKMIQIVESL